MRLLSVVTVFIFTVSSFGIETEPDSMSQETHAISVNILGKTQEKQKKVLLISRIGLGVLAAGFVGLGVYNTVQAETEYQNYSNQTTGPQGTIDDTWKAVEQAEYRRNLFYGLSAVSLVGFSLTFDF